MLLVFSPLNAQIAHFWEPQDPEREFNMSSSINNTGVGGCELNSASLNVMVWDGTSPGFGWDWDFGAKTGNSYFTADGPVHDPDVVVFPGDVNTYAHMVYELDGYIYYEIWEYDFSANSWSVYKSSTQLSNSNNCSNPNIDRYGNEIAVVWNEESHYIKGVTGTILGNYNALQNIYVPSGSQGDFIEPDVAIGSNYLNQKGYTLTCKEVDGNSTTLWAVKYDFVYNFPFQGTINLLGEQSNDISYGTPRVAADLLFNGSTTPWCFQIVMVEHNDGEHNVYGFNNYDPPVNTNILNVQEYDCPYGSGHIRPADYYTKEPVVSFLEDIHVAWAYQMPHHGYSGNMEIIYRRLDVQTGEPRPGSNGDFYSLVNGDQNGGIFDYDHHHPCIASRYNYRREKFIGWMDEKDEKHPEYKLRQTNAEIFGAENSLGNSILYPNPAQNTFSLQIDENKELCQVTIYSLDGKKVSVKNNIQSYEPIDVTGLKQGMYIVEIKTTQATVTKRLLKQ